MGTTRHIRIFRYQPGAGDDGHFDRFSLEIPDERATTILDVLLRVQQEQDPTIAFRFACRVNMCGSCGMVINGKEGLGCKTNVSEIPAGKEITLRPLNHFPVIKDLVVDMDPFFNRYEAILPYYEAKDESAEPALIRPDSRERLDIGGATECIACGCCVSSCTMAYYQEGYAGPAALNRAFTLLADSRDGLHDERLSRALESCYNCRTEFNCTEVCPKEISPTRAIKFIQRMALTAAAPAAIPAPALEDAATAKTDRRTFLRALGIGAAGAGTVAALGIVGAGAIVGPALPTPARQWVAAGTLDEIPMNGVTSLLLRFERKNGIYTERVAAPLLISRTANEIVCFSSSCPHLGCTVHWDRRAERFRCACHGGNFDRDGSVLAGPPPHPLGRYPFRTESGQLLVEVG